MKQIEIHKTYPEDFEKIFPLLKEFNSPYSKEDWKRIFYYDWEGAEPYKGFHLVHENVVVGFMGLIFSCRYQNNKKYQICNITSLIVKEKYRSSTILFLRKLNELKEVIFTGLRPIEESYRLLKMIGFEDLEKNYLIIPAINFLFAKKKSYKTYKMPIILERLDGEERRMISDHANLQCESVLFEIGGESCLIVFSNLQQAFGAFYLRKCLIRYISDVSFFNRNINYFLHFFYQVYGLFSAIYIDKRFFKIKKNIFSVSRKISPPRIYKCHKDISLEIDELYSENVLL